MRKIPNPRMNSQAQGEGYGDKGKLYKPQETTQLQPEEERQLTKAGEREKSREWGRSKGVCAKAARWGRGTFRPFIESGAISFRAVAALPAAESSPVPSCTAVALPGGTPDAGALSDAQPAEGETWRS
jgi:hypothetical protein